MNGTRDTSPAGTDGDRLDPQDAATLLEQTRRQARRRLESAPPWLSVLRAVLVLAACGVVWLSVRGQHPYRHPTAAAILAVVAFGVVNLIATVAVARHATTGVHGRSRLRPAEIAILSATWIVPYVLMWPLADAGVDHTIVYGWYPTSVPLIVTGLAWAGIMATRARWRAVGTGVAVVVIGVVGVFAGPVGAWAVAGVGLCVALLGNATAVAVRRR